MQQTRTSSSLLLLLTAIIWGFAFVAQKAGMEFMGPFTFNAARFLLGAFLLIPLVIKLKPSGFTDFYIKQSVKGGIFAGILLFCGASLQQFGIVYTTAGNAGFITGFYVVLVPVFGILFSHKTAVNVWIGALLALAGMYFLSVSGSFVISKGDILIFLSAFVWAFHVLVIGKYAPIANVIIIAVVQFFVCGLLSTLFAAYAEPFAIQGFRDAAIPILYGGVLSVALAFTLQVVVQKHVHPSLAAIILSAEALFAAIGGWIILNESLTMRGILGCMLMLCGMVVAQINFNFKRQKV